MLIPPITHVPAICLVCCRKPLPTFPVPGAAPASPFFLCFEHQKPGEEMGAPVGVRALVRGIPGQRPCGAGCPAGHHSTLGTSQSGHFGKQLATLSDSFFSSSPQADDQAPCQATGMRPRRRAGHQGARVLPLHRLG